MNYKFKKHDKVRLVINPNPEYIEYHTENQLDSEEQPLIKKGDLGRVNLILPNSQYHVEIFDKKGNPVAYVMVEEEALEAA